MTKVRTEESKINISVGTTDEQGFQKNAVVLCTSDNGQDWVTRRKLVDDGNSGIDYKALNDCWMPIDGRNLLVYALRSRSEEGGDRTEPIPLHISKGDENWRNWEYRGVFYQPSSTYPDFDATRGVSFIPNLKEPLILYEAGQNRTARIVLLKLEKDTITDGF